MSNLKNQIYIKLILLLSIVIFTIGLTLFTISFLVTEKKDLYRKLGEIFLYVGLIALLIFSLKNFFHKKPI